MSHSLYRRTCALGLTLTVLAPCTAAAASPTAAAVDYFEGRATSPSTGKLLYTEAHWVGGDADNAQRLVLYRCPDGKPFARKRIVAQGHAQAPDFSLIDGRDGYHEGVRTEGSRRVVYVRRDARSKERTATLEISPPPVIDAGFDVYIRSHWDSLGKRGSDTIPFLIPNRLASVRVKVRRLGDTTISGRQSRQYRLGLASWIGFALPHLILAYDEKTRELLLFEGLGNIRGNDGDHVKVRVVFDPGQDHRVRRADLDEALGVELDGTCLMP